MVKVGGSFLLSHHALGSVGFRAWDLTFIVWIGLRVEELWGLVCRVRKKSWFLRKISSQNGHKVNL